MKKLLLIDGNAILHRAYHAYPPLTNTKGEVINAVYGFFTMMLMMLREQKPEYLAVCFDRSAPTIRQTMYAGYHEDRPKPDEDFISQINLVHELLGKMKVQIFEQDGYEGDDLIGTLAVRSVMADAVKAGPAALSSQSARARLSSGTESTARLGSPSLASPANESLKNDDIEVVIVTGDRDMLQLVNHRVQVLMPITGISKTVLFDEAAVEAKYGVHPRQFIDYKALIGDQSDGYPGVAGIGPKTASKLIVEYGTFENLYEHIGDLPEKIGLKLATDAEQAALAKKLATIITDVPVQYDLTKCKVSEFDLAEIRKEFEAHGFKSLLVRLDGLFGSGTQKKDEKKSQDEKKKNGQLNLLD